MKFLTVYDEIKNVRVIGNRYDENAIYKLDAETDKEIRGIAKQYFAGDKSVKLRRMAKENAYMLYADTEIKYAEKKQSQGITVQYNMIDKQICDICFFTMDADKAGDVATIMSNRLHRIHYTKGNADALLNDKLFYENRLVKMFKELGEKYDLENKDYGVYHKNLYLLLEKSKLKQGFIFELYQAIKDATGDENCHYSKEDRCITFKINGEEKRVNILGGQIPEMDGYMYMTKEGMMQEIHAQLRGERTAPPIFYGGTELYLRNYSHTKNLDDIIDSRFKDKYLESLIAYNSNITLKDVETPGTGGPDDPDLYDER